MRVDQLAQSVRRHEKIAPPREAEQRPPCDREDVLTAQRAPDRLELADALKCRGSRVIRAVERTHAGAQHHGGRNPMRDERMQHADLDGAKAAAARENESCLWLVLAWHDAILVKLAALHTRPDHSHEGDNCGFLRSQPPRGRSASDLGLLTQPFDNRHSWRNK